MEIILDNIIFSLQKSGGVSVVWYELLNRVLQDLDFELYILEMPNQNIFRKQIEIPNEIFIDNPFSKFPLSVQRYLNPNRINVNGIFHSSYYRTVKKQGIANVTTVHDFTYEYYRKGPAKKIHVLQKGNAIRNSQKIICVSENTKNDLLKFYPDTNEKNIHVIYNGVDETYTRLTHPVDFELKKLIPFLPGEYVLYVGDRKSKYKNFELAVKSCKSVNIPLVIVGGGVPTRSETSYLISNLGVNNYKHLSGINNKLLNLVYNHALCLLYPSKYEGFGIPVIEAQKAGCPVIAYNSSSIPEVIGDVSTLLNELSVESISGMIYRLITDLGFRNQQIEIGLENSKRFSWDKCYQQTKQVYKELYEEYF